MPRWSVHRCRRFFNVLGREINKLNAGNFPSGSPRLHHFVKLEGLGVGALRVKERRQSGCVLAFHCCFVFVGECFFLRGRGGTTPNASVSTRVPATVKIFVEVFMAATVVGSVSARQANSKKKNRC